MNIPLGRSKKGDRRSVLCLLKKKAKQSQKDKTKNETQSKAKTSTKHRGGKDRSTTRSIHYCYAPDATTTVGGGVLRRGNRDMSFTRRRQRQQSVALAWRSIKPLPLACATVSSVMSQLFQVTTITIVCSTRFCTSASLLWLWMASTLHPRRAKRAKRTNTKMNSSQAVQSCNIIIIV